MAPQGLDAAVILTQGLLQAYAGGQYAHGKPDKCQNPAKVLPGSWFHFFEEKRDDDVAIVRVTSGRANMIMAAKKSWMTSLLHEVGASKK